MLRPILATAALLAGCLAGTVITTAARASTVPPPPSGWTTVFSDDFAGPAGSPPSSANWFYDIGTNYGTGEIEQTTNSTSNVYLDGNGHLDITATDTNGTWTSGRIETTRDDFEAPPGGEYSCDGDPGQEWSVYNDGTLRVQGGCLDVVSAGTSSGTDVDWYPCNGTAAQTWTAESNGELVNPNSGLCLTDPGGDLSDRLDIETCTGSAEQLWTLPAASSAVTATGTGGWQNWVTSAPITASPVPSGVQTLYVTFTTDSGGNFANVNWFQFT